MDEPLLPFEPPLERELVADEVPQRHEVIRRPACVDGVARPFERAWIGVERLDGVLGSLLMGAVLCAGAVAGVLSGKLHGKYAVLAFSAVALLVLVRLVVSLVWPPLEWAKAGWRAAPDRIETWRGLLWRRWTSVPVSRVQSTDVKQGPLMRRRGIATLVVHTAGTLSSETEFEGLSHAQATELRDWLVAQTGSDAV